jgi:hypothetical protein
MSLFSHHVLFFCSVLHATRTVALHVSALCCDMKTIVTYLNNRRLVHTLTPRCVVAANVEKSPVVGHACSCRLALPL